MLIPLIAIDGGGFVGFARLYFFTYTVHAGDVICHMYMVYSTYSHDEGVDN